MKHIVVIVDGTWISAADSENPFSNAYNLNWMLDNKAADGNAQVVFYSSEIGTDKDIGSYFSGATAEGIDNQVREAYINICSNYQHGDGNGHQDKIYLFGFSRGAVVARALSAMISKFGILRPAYMDLFPTLWKRFTNPEKYGDKSLTEITSRQNVNIEFVGLFDCVFGYRGNKGNYYTLRFTEFSVPKNVKYAINILSLDDSRVAFSPMLWDSISTDEDSETVLEQIWMPGVHSDIGGTYKSNALGRVALFSMIDLVVQRTSLGFHEPSIDRMEKSVSDGIEVNIDISGFWKLMAIKEFSRKCGCAAGEFLHPIVMEIQRTGLRKYKGKEVIRYLPAAFGANELKQYEGFSRKDWRHFIYPRG